MSIRLYRFDFRRLRISELWVDKITSRYYFIGAKRISLVSSSYHVHTELENVQRVARHHIRSLLRDLDAKRTEAIDALEHINTWEESEL